MHGHFPAESRGGQWNFSVAAWGIPILVKLLFFSEGIKTPKTEATVESIKSQKLNEANYRFAEEKVETERMEQK